MNKSIAKRKSGNDPVLTEAQRELPDLKWVDGFSRMLDTKFRIPLTNVRFGVDFLLGLVPGAGDFISLCFSGLLVVTMAKNGASGKLVFRMLLNVLLDAVVGTVPLAGNLFDLFYKANYRNLELMKEHYSEGKHSGSVWPIVLGVVAFIAVVFAVLVVLLIWLASLVSGWLSNG